jgi:hypothetical protein
MDSDDGARAPSSTPKESAVVWSDDEDDDERAARPLHQWRRVAPHETVADVSSGPEEYWETQKANVGDRRPPESQPQNSS